MIGFALVLALGAAAGWLAAEGVPSAVRAYLRLAAVLYGAMAVSEAFAVAPPAVRDIVMSLGAAVLCVAAGAGFRNRQRWLTATAYLGACAAAGIAAAMLGQSVLAAAPQALSTVLMLALARRGVLQGARASIYLALAALCLLGSAACGLSPGDTLMTRAGLLLFAAAAVAGVGLASNLLVVERSHDRGALAIRRAR